MKKLAILLFVSCVFSINSFAQKSVVIVDQSKKAIVEEKSVTFEFTVNNIDNEQEQNDFFTKFKNRKEVLSVSHSSINNGMVVFTVKSAKDNFYKNCQDMLAAAGIEEVEVSGTDKKVKISELAKTAMEMARREGANTK